MCKSRVKITLIKIYYDTYDCAKIHNDMLNITDKPITILIVVVRRKVENQTNAVVRNMAYY